MKKNLKFKIKLNEGSVNKVKVVKIAPNKYKLKINLNPNNSKGLKKEFYKAVYELIPKNTNDEKTEGNSNVEKKTEGNTNVVKKTEGEILERLYMNEGYTRKADQIAFVLRGIFNKIQKKEGDKIDVNDVYKKLNEMVPNGSRRQEIQEAIEKIEKEHKDQLEVYKSLLDVTKKAEENALKEKEEKEKSAVLKAVGTMVENVNEKAELEKRLDNGDELSKDEVQMLINAYKRLKRGGVDKAYE